MKKMILCMAMSVLPLVPAVAMAAGNVSVFIKAEKEEVVVKNGQKETRRVPVTTTDAGDVIIYTINYKNSGNETANNAIVDDPIPQGTVYVVGSVYGANADITFSIDNGKTFKKPTLLNYEIRLPGGKTEKRTASPEEYTHIRWDIKAIPPGAAGQVGFRVRVK